LREREWADKVKCRMPEVERKKMSNSLSVPYIPSHSIPSNPIPSNPILLVIFLTFSYLPSLSLLPPTLLIFTFSLNYSLPPRLPPSRTHTHITHSNTHPLTHTPTHTHPLTHTAHTLTHNHSQTHSTHTHTAHTHTHSTHIHTAHIHSHTHTHLVARRRVQYCSSSAKDMGVAKGTG
jgi:hypothetical protein